MFALRADITTLDVDAIVNAANEDLFPGGGVCGAIHRAAGPELARACARVAPCPTGEARITPGFNLSAKYVIHAVGPVWRGGQAGEAAQLASAYRASIALAQQQGLRSIAFPAISAGIFGYPLQQATDVAVTAVRLLSLLASNAGKVVTYGHLLSEVWGPEYSGEDTHVLEAAMARLRKRLAEGCGENNYIGTRRGIGYFFNAPSAATRGSAAALTPT